MKNKLLKIILYALIVSFVIAWTLQARCYDPIIALDIDSHQYIDYLYPGPDAKVPFACSTWAFLKSPLAPQKIELVERIFREDGLQVLGGYQRGGAIVVQISVSGELYRLFPETVKWGETPPFVNAVSLYVDGKDLQIGHIGYKEFGNVFDFSTILDPFLWPGKHNGKLLIQVPSGENIEFEWYFEITWW